MRLEKILPHPSRLVTLFALVLSVWQVRAEVLLPGIFGSHMVLQRGKPLVIWGWAQPGETITIKLANESRQAQANERGEWKLALPAMQAGGPYRIIVSGSSTVEFEDVMVGEVWLASGQSNMEMGIGVCKDGKAEIAGANHPNIRLLMVPNRWAPTPQTNVNATWKVCSPKTVVEDGWGGFSAAAYYFGRELHKELGVTVGLIDATWGGTRIESWTPPEGFAAVASLQRDYELVQLADPRTKLHRARLQKVLTEMEQWLNSARGSLTQAALVAPLPAYPSELLPPRDVQNATALYNGMIHPLSPFPIRGAIWYQGESNSDEGMLYAERMKALVEGWRRVWAGGDFPFYFVQIAPFNYGGNPERIGEFWEAQATAAREITNAGMAVITDIGDLKDIHPTNKQEVGHRLALLALAKTYGHENVGCSGPMFESLSTEGNKLRVRFTNATGALSSRDGKPLSWFEIIDANEGGFVPAEAKIEGTSVLLSSADVKHPVAMRFAWSMLAEPNLVNSAGLPASAFRAGNFSSRDLLDMKVPEAKRYQLVYELDLAKVRQKIAWDIDNRARIQKPFDRVAYFLELQTGDSETQYVFASMDAFTESLEKIGIPTLDSGANFQQNVTSLNVYSNVKGLTTGTNLAGGNIEFWPGNYGAGNAAKVPNASDQVYDFGDQVGDPADGYGSMQIHNHDARQTVLAVNHWREGEKADIGIGNQATGNPDWTFAANAASYAKKRLRILVRAK